MAETQEKDVVVQGRDLTPATDPAYNPADSSTRKTPLDNPPDGRKPDTISVTYNPGPGDPQRSEIFGKKVKAGEAVDVPARFADKVAGNPYLSTDGKKDYVPPAAPEPEEQEEASFDQNVARERSQEYLEGRTNFANSPPGEAERVARAQQQAAELKAAVESDDTEKPPRSRSPKKPEQE